MKKKYQLTLIESMEALVDINRQEKELMQQFNEKRREEILPLHNELDEMREEAMTKLTNKIAPELGKIEKKLGLDNDSEVVRKAFRIGISAKILEMFENYISGRAIEIDKELVDRFAEVKKEL